jgi:hypothetical protein
MGVAPPAVTQQSEVHCLEFACLRPIDPMEHRSAAARPEAVRPEPHTTNKISGAIDADGQTDHESSSRRSPMRRARRWAWITASSSRSTCCWH